MSRKAFKKVLSVAMSVILCGSLILPATVGGVSAATPIKIACVGDSITAGSQASNAAFHYPTQLQQLLGSDYEVKNFGVSGRTLLSKGDNPYINDNAFTNSKNFNPDYVIIMLGTNDAKPQNWTHKADFEADMKAMIETYRALSSKPTVIIATSPTVGTTNIGIAEAVVTDEIVPIQKAVAAEMGCPVIDINTLTKGAPQNYADGIHPNDAGYTAMAKMFYEGLQDIFNARIKDFSVNGVSATIDEEAATISLTLPYGSSVTALDPVIDVANGSAVDKGGVQNFQNPVTYTVTSPDGKDTKTYTATVKAQAKIKIACVGDSITAGAGGSNGINYPNQLAANLGSGYDVRNFGNSGKTLLKEGIDGTNVVSGYVTTDTYRNSINFAPDVVIFMLGTNDSKPQNWNTLGDKFEAEMRELLQVYLDLPSQPKVYVATSPTAHNNGGYGIQPAVIHDEIVPLQKKVAAEMGLTVIDMHAMTADNATEFPDNIHPNNDGYIRMGRDFADFIKKDVTTLSSFTLKNAIGVIDNDQNTVTVTLPAGTDVTALEPALTLPAGAAYSPAGVQNFTAPVKYTVTAADGTATREYTVTVKVQEKIKVALVGDSMTAANEYPTALTEFLGKGYEVGRFGVNSTTVQKDGQKETGDKRGAYIYHPQYQQSLNFAPDIVLLTLGSNDSKQAGTNANWVTNWTDSSPANFENDLKELVASYQAIGATVVLGTSPSGYDVPSNWGAKSAIVNNQIAPIQRKVAAEMGCFLSDFNAATLGKETTLISGDGLHPNFNGYYTLAALKYVAIQDSLAAITDFVIDAEHAVIDQADKTVFLSVPDGTDLTALNPTVTLADGAVADKTGPQNFGQKVIYTVTAANGWTVEYEVSVTSPSGVTVSKIEMLTMPSKTTFLKGESLDTTGATISVVYTDGTREEVDVTPDMVSGYDWLKVAKQELTVNYEGKTTTLTVQVIPHGVLGSFSAMNGKARVLGNGQNLLYADWKWADQYPIDLSGYGDRADLSLELDITFGSEQDIDPAAMWSQLIVKLRSQDKPGVAGDPETNNSEHNYGWNLYASSFTDKGSVHLSIPLNQACTNKRGVMDWSTVGRIIIQCYLNDQYKANSIDHYMDIQNVYIVDNSQIPAAPDTTALQAAVTEADKVDATLYTAETAAVFTAALNTAKAYLENPYAAQAEVDAAIDALAAAIEGLEEKPPYVLGNVDMDEENAITANDALMALQAATSKISLSEQQTMAANVDGEGAVTANDALLILQRATKKIASFPAEAADSL